MSNQPVRRHPRLFWLASVLACGLGVVGVGGEYLLLRSRQEARTTAWANQLVEAKMATARAHLDLHHWDEAIGLLDDALTQDHATNQEEARALLERARQGQAAVLLEDTNAAIARQDAGAALRLLRDYLAYPQATDRERATALRQEIEWAISDEEATRLLAGLSDGDLALLAQQGQLTAQARILTEGVREIFKDTLRRHLPRELQQRESRREAERLAEERRAAERALRLARLRNTPAFRLVSTFVAQTRQKMRAEQELAQRQEKALVQLFQQLNVNDPAEQAKIRANLKDSGLSGDIAENIDLRRAEAKKAYRASPTFDPADCELFDQFVDQELDQLLREST